MLVAMLLVVAVQAADRRPSSRVITTKYGTMRGQVYTLSNRHLQPVEVFLGIPYASAPVGSLRFMPPVTPPHWRGVKEASVFGHVCPQRLPDVTNETEANRRMPMGRVRYLQRLVAWLGNQSEDCLYLNIYTPYAVSKEPHRLPVLVFIHGEGYDWNSGNPYDASVLSSFGNIVVVTINYRLGILGFLPAADGSAKGNYALMDQVAALHWIQENIGEFGGDPRNVTLWGHTHGAACVSVLMLSPMARKLFHRVILHSGSALSPWALAREAPTYTRHLAKSLGCPLHDNIAMVECMRQRPVEEIMRVQLVVPRHLTAFGPTVDRIVLPNEPETLMDNNKYGQFDLLFGVTRAEAYFHFVASEDRVGIDENRRDRLLRTMIRNLYTYHLQEIFLTVVNEYTDWTRPVQHPMNIFDGTLDALSDALVVASVTQAGKMHSQHMKGKTFFYVFQHQTEDSDYPSRAGCIQGEDLNYAFGAPLVTSLAHFTPNYTRAEVALSEAVLTYWTNFIKFGDPTPNMGESETSTERSKGRFERISWLPYDTMHQRYLAINTKPKVRDHYHAHRLSFWLDLIPKLHATGVETAYVQHHLLEEHDNHGMYDGVVRQFRLSTLRPMLTSPSPPLVSTDLTRSAVWSSSAAAPTPQLTTSLSPSVGVEGVMSPSATTNISDYMAVVMQHTGYSTALSVTVAVGCSLLILNILIFAGIYYQRDKEKLETKLQNNRAFHSHSSQFDRDLSIELPCPKKKSPNCCKTPDMIHHHHLQDFSPPPPPPPAIKPLKPVPESQPLLVHGILRAPVHITNQEMGV